MLDMQRFFIIAAFDYESKGRGFESRGARHENR